jgi:hypothetical protein
MDPRRLLLGCALLAFAPALPAQIQKLQVAPLAASPYPAGAQARDQRLRSAVSVHVRQWVAAEAERQRTVPFPEVPAIAATAQAAFPYATAADIDALIYMVMMAVARDAEQDLREEMAAMKARLEEKRAKREAVRQAREEQAALREEARDEYASRQAAGPAAAPRLEPRATATLAQDPRPEVARSDALGDLGAERSLRLQMLQDRRQQALETLSNLMKKTSDTEATISANLK